jgi:hypothetical protein
MKMKKTYLLLVWALLLGIRGWAQPSETIRIKTGEQVPVLHKYLYQQFSPGTVALRNGQKPTVRLNYHMMLREIQFIAPAGDTLTLANLHTISHILLNGDMFVFDQNNLALKVLGEYGLARLAVNPSLQVANVDKEGAYGQSSGLSSISSYSSYPTGNGSIAKLELKGDVVYSQRRNYFLINQSGLSFPANRKSVLKLYPRQKAAINEYLRGQPAQLNNPEELRKLLEFCNARS